MRQAVALLEIAERAAGRGALVAHRRKDEDFLERQLFGQHAVEPHIGEHAARDAEAARAVPRDQARHRAQHDVLQHLLDRGGGILAAHLGGERADEAVHLGDAGKIREHAARLVDREAPRDPLREHRLAECRKPGQLAFMAQRNESERRGHRHVGFAHAVDRLRHEPAFLAAIDRRELAVREDAMAVVDGVAAGIRRDQQRVVPRRVEQRRERMRLVVIVEKDPRVGAQAARAAEFRRIEHRVVRAPVAQDLRHHVPARIALDVLRYCQCSQRVPLMLRKYSNGNSMRPSATASMSRRVAPAIASTSSIARSGCCAPVALVARQPLELHRRAQLVVLEQRRARVVKIGMQRQDELGHRLFVQCEWSGGNEMRHG